MLRIAAATTAMFFALALPALADKGGGNAGDTSPGNSGEHKVVICHHAGPTKTITITVDEHAVPAHLAHGDTIGPCPPAVPPPVAPGETPVGTTPETPAAGGPQAPQPGQVVAPQRVAGKQPANAKRVAGKQPASAKRAPQRVARAQVKLAKRVAAARLQPALPYTGMPAGLVAGLGLVLLAAGLAIRRRMCYSS